MPRVPTAPLPELTTRGTKRKNRLYCPEEKVQKALDLIRQGVFILRAARICDVPEKRLQARVRELRARGELDIFWGKNAPGYLEKIKKENGEDVEEEVGPDGKKKRKQHKPLEYTPETVYAAANAIREGLYTLHSASNIFKVPRRVIQKVLNGKGLKDRPHLAHESEFVKIMGKMGPNTEETSVNWRHFSSNKLSPEEEQLIVNYSLALYNISQPVTLKSIFPLTNRLLEERGSVVRDPHCWFKSFVTRHPELENKTFTTTDIYKTKPEYWINQLLTRLTTVYDTNNFHVKPSRIYSWHSMQYSVERWEPDRADYLNVDILVAANAVGYHILPPCVVYANDGSLEVPDFLGLPEAGFVASDETRRGMKILTPAILVEWFRSVFLQYLPARSPDDPIALVLPGAYDWITPELVSLAEQNYVHLIPVNPKVMEQLSPLLILLNQLKESYYQTLAKYRDKNLPKQAKEPSPEAFFPVKFRKLFSSCFSMYNIQEAFKTTGIFPLNPERFQQVQTENETPLSEPDAQDIENVTKTKKTTAKHVINTTPKSGNRPAPGNIKPRVIKYCDIDITSQDQLVVRPIRTKSTGTKPTATAGAATDASAAAAGDDDAADSDYMPTADTGPSPAKKIKTKSATKSLKNLPRNVSIEILPVEVTSVQGEPVTPASGTDSKTAAPPTSAAMCIIRHKASVSMATSGLSTTSTSTLGEAGGSSSASAKPASSSSSLEDSMIILKDAQTGLPLQGIPVTVSSGSGSFVLQKAMGASGNSSQIAGTVTTDSSSIPGSSASEGELTVKKSNRPQIIKTEVQSKVGKILTSATKPQEGNQIDILSKAFRSDMFGKQQQQPQQQQQEETCKKTVASAFTTTAEDGTVVITLTGMSGDIAGQEIALDSPGTSSSDAAVVLVMQENDESGAATTVMQSVVDETEVREHPKTISTTNDTVTLHVDEDHEKDTVYQNAQILSSLAQQVSEDLTKKPPQPDPPIIPFSLHQSGKVGTANTAPVKPAVQPVGQPTLVVNPAVQPVVLSASTPIPTMIIPAMGSNPANIFGQSNKATLNSAGTSVNSAADIVDESRESEQSIGQSSSKQSTCSTDAQVPASGGSKLLDAANAGKTVEETNQESTSSSDVHVPVSKALDSNVGKTVEETNKDSATAKSSDVSSQSAARKSPRKQTLVVKMPMDTESDRDVSTADRNKPQDDDESDASRKRKGSPLSSSQKVTDQISSEQNKKVKTVEGGSSETKVTKNVHSAGDESGSSETRMTRAKTKEEASPSRRTRSMKN